MPGASRAAANAKAMMKRTESLLAVSVLRADRIDFRATPQNRHFGATDRTRMVVLNRIYTRAGDDGSTALGTGERRKKYDLRIAAYGTLDEANAVLGIARIHTADDPAFDALLGRIQNDLFDVGADLCMPGKGKGPGGARLTVTDAQVTWLEQEIDRLNAELQPLKSFILPGGTPAAAHLHLARTVCRRAERIMVELGDKAGESVTPEALKYVNRLSDFLFVAGRWANQKGARDVLWVPGQNR